MLKWISLLMVLCVGSAFGQKTMRFSHLNKTHGLSNNVVNCMIQDADGFIWIGTHEGLNRYDGRNFKQFKLWNEAAQKQANIINNLYLDKHNRLWACTADGGLFYLERGSFDFQYYPLDSPSLSVFDIQQSPGGTYYVGFERSPALKFEFEKSQLELERNWYFRHDLIYHFFESYEGNVVAAPLGAGLVAFEEKWHPAFDSYNDTLSIPTVTGFVENKEFSFFGGWNDQIYKYNRATKKTQTFTTIDPSHENDDEIKCLTLVGSILWVGSRRTGLHLINTNTREETLFSPSLWDKEAISSNEINCFLQDHEGRVWIGTSNGISLFDPILFQFSVDYLPGALLSQNGTNKINCLYEDQDQILVGTHNGMFSFRDRTFTHLPLSTKGLSIYSIQRDQRKRLWIGSNKSIHLLRETDLSITPINTYYSIKNKYKTYRLIFDLPSSRVGNIIPRTINNEEWMLSSVYGYTLFAFHTNSLSGTRVSPFVTQSGEQVLEGLVRKLYVDRRDQLWVVGFTQGLMFNPIYPENLTEETFANLGRETTSIFPDSLFNPLVPTDTNQVQNLPQGLKGFDLIEFADKKFYFTTYGNGLYLIEEKNNRWIAKQLDSPHKSLEGIQVDDSGCIWIIASGGFDCYRPQIDNWQRFDYRDGFPEKGVSGDLYKLNDGRFMACGEGFLVSFDPLKIQVNTSVPKTVLTSLSVLNKPSDSLLNQKNIQLKHSDNFIEFEFSALNFTNGIMNQFNYQLEGVDETVINAGTRNFVSYADLEPGEYTFKVWSSNNHRIWNTTPTEFSFLITPPFWKKTSFYILFGLVLLGIIFMFYKSRLNALQAKQKLRMEVAIEAQEKERNRLAAELHDDLGTKLSTLKLFLNSLDQLEHSTEHTKRINTSAQELLDGSITGLRNVLADLSPRVLFKRGLSAAIEDLVSQLNKSDDIDVYFTTSDQYQRTTEAKELAVFRVVQELINNSLKHAQCTEIHIQLGFKDGLVSMRYEDNGIGFPKEILEQGYGIRNIKQRIELHNGEAHWHNASEKPFSGTVVLISLPS